MRVVDDAVLAALGAVSGLTVYDGEVPRDAQGRTTAAVPYAVLFSQVGRDLGYRVSGRAGLRAVDFQVTYGGLSRAQAKWAGERVRSALAGVRMAGKLVRCHESQYVRPDLDARTTDDQSVFYGSDTYSCI